MSIRSKRRLAAEINVVPYIDVMLVLLIIFMVTAPLLTTGVNVDLPNAPAKVMDKKDDNPIVLTVEPNGDMSLNVGESTDTALSSAAISSTVSKILRSRPKAQVMVRGDGKASYSDVVRGMVILQRAGAAHVGLLTDNDDSSNKGSQ